MNDFEKMSEDIRKAFRLLLVFTKTFRSIVKYVEDTLELTYTHGLVSWGTPVQNKAKNLDKDCTLWFPLYYHGFNFIKGRNSSFSIILQCDTGFWDNYEDEIQPEKYSNVSEAKTNIVFGATNKAGVDIASLFDSDDNSWNDNTKKYKSYITKDRPEEFSLSAGTRTEKKIFFRVYKLSDFKDKETAKKTLENFVDYLKKKGITDFEIKSVND